MARIQNKNYPWTTVRLHTGRVVQTDGDGVLECSDEEANFLGSTPHWGPPDTIGSVRTAVGIVDSPAAAKKEPPRVTPKLSKPGSEKAKAAEEPAEPPGGEAAKEGEEEPEEGPDLDAVRTKEQALAIAKQYGVETVTEGMKLSEMKDALDKALYGEG